MAKKQFLWWHQDPDEYKEWLFLNSLDVKGQEKFAKQIADKRLKYGNLYFYKPIPKLEPFHKDNSPQRNIYGNNGSGKSMAGAADTGYEWIGFSPFRDIPRPDFGSRLIWVATTDYGIQLDSSQLLLFADVLSPAKDIGLLPDPEILEDHGFEIVWENKRKGVLNSVVNPWDGSRIVFKSMESKTNSFAGAPLDYGWIDEIIPAEKYDELLARTLRKHGRLTMTFLIKDANESYTFNTLYKNYQDDLKRDGHSSTSFYFVAIEDNTYLDQEDIARRKKKFTSEGSRWRFTEGGFFPIEPEGQLLYHEYDSEYHVREGLIREFDPLTTLYRVWDLGWSHPCCTFFQIDKLNRKKFLLTILGHEIELRAFLDQIQAETNLMFPGCLSTHEILPHDAARRSATGVSAERPIDIFDERGLFDRSIIKLSINTSIQWVNKALANRIQKVPEILLDQDYTTDLQNALTFMVREENGNIKKDERLSHPSDNMKLAITYCMRQERTSELEEKKKQGYQRPVVDLDKAPDLALGQYLAPSTGE